MPLESVSYVGSLNASNPTATDNVSQGDDHIRLIKTCLVNSFGSITAPVTATAAELNVLDGITATTAELNILDGVTATSGELNQLIGITALIAGTYTPTVTPITNCTGGTASTITSYMRISNVVHVSGNVQIDFSGSGDTQFDLSLPFASDFSAFSAAIGGCCIAQTNRDAGYVSANSTDDRARVFVTNTNGAGNLSVRVWYQYIVT